MAAEPTAPANLDAEENVLGAMLIAPSAIDAAVDANLKAEHFYRPSHGIVYTACIALYLADAAVDPITVGDHLAQHERLDLAGGQERLHELAAIVPSTTNAGHYARIVREQAALRALITAGAEIQRMGRERGDDLPALIERAERLIFDLAHTGRSRDFISVADVITDTYRGIEESNKHGNELSGLGSGFRAIDNLTNGFQPGNLIVVAARPSMGKTALALGIAAHVAVSLHKPVAMFTLEMSLHEVIHRLIAVEGLVNAKHFRKLDSDEWGRVTATAAKLHETRFLVDDTGDLTVLELRAKARRARMRNPELALIVVDYLQLLSSGVKYESRVQDVSQISRALKVLAGELQVPVLALSQLSRAVESRHDKRPILSDLRESGSIEQDADLVAFLYRDAYYNPEETDQQGIAELNIAKQRNGPTGTVKLAWVEQYTRFNNLELG